VYYTYILQSLKYGKLYIGISDNLRRRVSQHNSGHVKSTAPFTPYQLVWYGAFETKQKARDFEVYLKSSSGHAFLKKRLV